MFYVIIFVFIIKYLIQFVCTYKTNKNRIATQGKPFVHSIFIWGIAVVFFTIFIFRYNELKDVLLGFFVLLTGTVIGILGIITLGYNYNENLVIYTHANLETKGIYSIIRHPIRLGINMEVTALFLFIGCWYLLPLLLTYFYLNHKRTLVEDSFLLMHFGNIAQSYQSTVPQYNIIRGIIDKLRVR